LRVYNQKLQQAWSSQEEVKEFDELLQDGRYVDFCLLNSVDTVAKVDFYPLKKNSIAVAYSSEVKWTTGPNNYLLELKEKLSPLE
jgi:hypothetical protein